METLTESLKKKKKKNISNFSSFLCTPRVSACLLPLRSDETIPTCPMNNTSLSESPCLSAAVSGINCVVIRIPLHAIKSFKKSCCLVHLFWNT